MLIYPKDLIKQKIWTTTLTETGNAQNKLLALGTFSGKDQYHFKQLKCIFFSQY